MSNSNTSSPMRSTSYVLGTSNNSNNTSTSLNSSSTQQQGGRRLNLKHLKLYGRLPEITQLKGIYRRIDQGGAESLLVKGPAGIGKTHLIEKAFLREECYLATGTIERDDGPFESILQALSELIVMLCEDEDIHDAMSDAVIDLLTELEMDTLGNFIPNFNEFFGDEQGGMDDESSYCWSVNVQESLLKRMVAVRKFMRIVCEESDGPIILAIHNLQWADAGTMGLIDFLANDTELEYFLFIGTYREEFKSSSTSRRASCSSSVSSCGSIATDDVLSSWQQQAADPTRQHLINPLTQMTLNGVGIVDVNKMLSDVMHLDEGDTFPLATIMMTRTNGIFLFILQLLDYWQNERLLTYDLSKFRYTWSICKLKDTALMDHVVDYVAGRIHSHPVEVQCVLTVAACIGYKVSPTIIQVCIAVLIQGKVNVPKALEFCVNERILECLSDGRVRFFHDKIHQATLNLVQDANQLTWMHLRIGILLWGHIGSLRKTGQKIDDRILFICAEQLSKGSTQAKDLNTKATIAQILGSAGTKATVLSAFGTAADYFEKAIDLLETDEDAKEQHLYTRMNLRVSYAEVLYNVGRCEESMAVITFVLSNRPTRTATLRLQVLRLRILKSQCHLIEFINSSLEFLEQLGEPLPNPHPTNFQVRSEAQKVIRKLNKITDEDILQLRRANSVIMGILNAMLVPLERLGMHNLAHITIFRAVRLSITEGVTELSPEAFALFGTYLISEKQDLAEGYRYGELALRLAKKMNPHSLDARVVHWVNLCTKPWQLVPLSQCVDNIFQGHTSAMKEGDPFTAFMTIDAYFTLSFCSSLDLRPLLRDIEEFSAQMLQYGQKMIFLQILPIWQCVLNLSGNSSTNPTDVTKGEAMDRMFDLDTDAAVSKTCCWAFSMQIAVYMGDMELAARMSSNLQACKMGIVKASCLYPSMVFFFGLIAIAKARSTGKRKYRLEASKHVLLMRQWVEKKAANLVPKLMILEAELETLETRTDGDVLRSKYDRAIATARKSGFLQDAAICAQLAGAALQKIPSLSAFSGSYIRQAILSWRSWGAFCIADKVRCDHKELFGSPSTTTSSLSHMSRASDTEGDSEDEDNVRSSNFRGRRRFDRRVSLDHQRRLSEELVLQLDYSVSP